MTDLVGTEYRGAIFQIQDIPVLNTDEPVVQVRSLVDWQTFNDSTGRNLSYSQYLDSALLLEDGVVDLDRSSQFINDIVSSVKRNKNDIEITINFTTPDLDPIGESRLWYRWIFYDDPALVKKNQIIGSPEPYFYSTYINVSDFFNTEDFLFTFYVMYATGMFWLLGLPFMYGWYFYQTWSTIFLSFDAMTEFNRWPGSDQYTFDLYLDLFMIWFEQQVAMLFMIFASWFPLIGPIVNFFVVLFIYISYQY